MGIDSKQLKEHVIEPTLKYLGLHSEAAVNLLLGTCAQESAMGTYIRQIGCDGDTGAFGIYQMELATESDIIFNYLNYRRELNSKVTHLIGYNAPDLNKLIFNLSYATAMARIHYLRVPETLPGASNIEGLARYWKKYYNTDLGKGTEQEFIENYERYVHGKA